MAATSNSNLKSAAIFLGIFGVVIIALRMATGGFGGGPGRIPACDDDFTRDLLKKTIDDSPQARLGLKVLKIGSMGENGLPPLLDDNKEVRYRGCVADVVTNVGRKAVYFNMSWPDEKKTEVYLEIPMPPF